MIQKKIRNFQNRAELFEIYTYYLEDKDKGFYIFVYEIETNFSNF